MNINERVRQVRYTVGLPQTKFAKRIAISTGFLAGIELGNKRVNERLIRLIGMEFDVDEHWLRTGEGSMHSDEADLRLIKMISVFKSLDPQFQDVALDQIEALAEKSRL